MYNFITAFILCGALVIIGEWVSTWSKAWIPSVFVTACLMLVGYWTVLPTTLIPDSNLVPFGSTVVVFLLVTHMGTVISIEGLLEQWKTVIICLVGLFGMSAVCYLVGPMLMDRLLVITGLPALTGGIVAATIMQAVALEKGFTVAAVFAITLYCVQGFAGYPLTAVCLKREGQRLIQEYREGRATLEEKPAEGQKTLSMPKFNLGRGILTMPENLNSPIVILTKLAIVAWLSMQLSGFIGLHALVVCLVLGVIFNYLGFLDTNSLNKANSYQIMMFALMMFIFQGLKDCTPEMLQGIIVPMILLIVVGVIGMYVLVFIAAKILKVSTNLAFANGLTALYGFPFNAVITEATCDAIAKTPEEKEFLMSRMFPSMIVGGFVTVTITSVIIAGVFAQML